MNTQTKKLLLAALTLLALCLSCALAVHFDRYTPDYPLSEEPDALLQDRLAFRVDGDSPKTVRCRAEGDTLYVFLPSYARMDRVRVLLPDSADFALDGVPLRNGMACGAFPPDAELTLEGDGFEMKLVFLASANVATMYVDTVTGDMKAIHADRLHKETASVILYDADGNRVYRSNNTDMLRGHGQSSWKRKKKSYNLYLGGSANLLGMGRAKKWILISNAIDTSGLRNWFVYTCASRVANYPGFSPDCAFVDLYLNGQYNGLYLLCEKIEIAPDKLDLDEGSWLFAIDRSDRSETMKNPVELGGGLTVEIKTPADCTDEQRTLLRDRLLDFQAALLSEDGVSPDSGMAWDDFIDLDSFARKYLIEEIFENCDAGAYSQYYFWNSADDRIYAGPCWDYDRTLALMVQKTPNCFLAQRERKSKDCYTPWFGALWRREAFRQRVVELYRDEFLPVIESMAGDDLPRQRETLRTALENNEVRWRGAYPSAAKYDRSADRIVSFLEKRIDFLSSAWIDGVEYRTVTFDLNGKADYRFYCLPAGASCADLPTPQKYGLKEGAVWRLESGEPFDLESTLDGDITLYGYNAAEVAHEQKGG